MQGHIGIGSGGRGLIVVGALLGLLLVPCASASAKTKPELALNVMAPLGAGFPSINQIRATQSSDGAEAISITSVTPSVCEVIGEVFGPNEEQPPEREVIAEVDYLAPGTCTFVAGVKATSATEANEVSESVNVVAVAGARVTTGLPVPTIPELAFEPPGGAYLGGVQELGAKSSRPGLQVVSVTPAVCTLGPAPVAPAALSRHAFAVQVKFLTTGTCTLNASLPETAEHGAVEVTKSILVATTTFTSTPPSSAAVGGAYEVSATSAPGVPVYLGAEGACSLAPLDVEKTLPPEGGLGGPSATTTETPPKLPATVYFVKTGTCTISAGGRYRSERVSQSFTVAMGPPEQITFTSDPPSPAVVGGTYWPWVHSSAGLAVTFYITTPSVCEIVSGPRGGQHVSLIAAGTCTIAVKVEGSSPGGPEAQQSFAVQMAPVSAPAPTATPDAPTSFKLVGRPRVDHRTAALSLKASCSGPGTVRWRVTFEGKRRGAAAGLGVFSAGAMKITTASTPILVVKPTKAALRTLRRAHKHQHGMSVKAVLQFDPSTGASPVSLERSILVRLA